MYNIENRKITKIMIKIPLIVIFLNIIIMIFTVLLVVFFDFFEQSIYRITIAHIYLLTIFVIFPINFGNYIFTAILDRKHNIYSKNKFITFKCIFNIICLISFLRLFYGFIIFIAITNRIS